MHKAAGLLREQATDVARHMTLELGKPLADSVAEVENCSDVTGVVFKRCRRIG